MLRRPAPYSPDACVSMQVQAARQRPAQGGSGIIRTLLLTAALWAAALAPEAQAGSRVQQRYYEVRGTTAAELGAGMTVGSPLGVTAATVLAPTQIILTPRSVQGGYVVGDLQFDDVIIQIMPRWVDRDRGRACLRREWDRAMEALRRHEDTHRRRYEDYVARLRREALALPPQPSPAALFSAVAALNSRLEAETVAWQENYDRRTQHGRTEGVFIRDC